MNVLKSFVILILLAFTCSAQEYPALGSHVNDYSGVLSLEQKNELETKLAKFEEETGNQVVILTVKSLNGEEKEDYANKVFKLWKLGQKDRNNGVLILNATDDRKARIEVGYGLEGSLTDALSSSIFKNDLSPNLKNGDYFTAYDLATTHIISATKGEYTAEDIGKASAQIGVMFLACIVGLFFFILSLFLSGYHIIAGGIAGCVGGLIIALMISGGLLMLGVIGFVVGLLSKVIITSDSSGGGSSGYSSYSSGSSSSDSGYSGGGGDSGGGGAGGDY